MNVYTVRFTNTHTVSPECKNPLRRQIFKTEKAAGGWEGCHTFVILSTKIYTMGSHVLQG